MAYAQGGLIAATDYNNFVGPNPSTTSGQLNTVWATGNGQYGYGQTPVAQSAATSGTVTATQWATLINALNNVYAHQTGAGTGIGAPTAGTLVNYLGTLGSSLTNIYTNHNNFASQGTTVSSSVFTQTFGPIANTTAAQTFTFTRTCTFSSGDAARYFFNAGGQLNFVTTGATNIDGSGRSGDLVSLAATWFGNFTAIRSVTNGGHSGTGGTNTTSNTGFGYYNVASGSTFGSGTALSQVNSTGYTYTGDYILLSMRTSGTSGTNGDKGAVVYLDFTVYSSARLAAELWNQTISANWSHRIDVVYPETTYLTSSWGTVTVT